MVPNSKNALITIALFNWIASWNAYKWPLLVTNSVNKRVLSIGLQYFKGEAGTDFSSADGGRDDRRTAARRRSTSLPGSTSWRRGPKAAGRVNSKGRPLFY
jgi:hypothetical protein